MLCPCSTLYTFYTLATSAYQHVASTSRVTSPQHASVWAALLQCTIALRVVRASSASTLPLITPTLTLPLALTLTQ